MPAWISPAPCSTFSGVIRLTRPSSSSSPQSPHVEPSGRWVHRFATLASALPPALRVVNDGAMGYGPQTTTDEVLDGVDLARAVVVVTGASSGLGVETSRALAEHGAEVVMAVRDPSRV